MRIIKEPRGAFAFLTILILGMPMALLVLSAPASSETIVFDTEIMSMDLSGSAVMPLGPSRGPISTSITLRESSDLSSIGRATAVGPDRNQGSQYQVQSFFDVFFDITFRDTDVNVNFPGIPDGSSLSFTNNGPAHLEDLYIAAFNQNDPDYGLFPPSEANPYIGFFNVEIPLGVDLDGNGELDKIKFTLGELRFSDSNRTFITLPDGTVINSLDSTLSLSGGVMDLSNDPPFGPITLTGPTTAVSRLENPAVPEPASLVLIGSGLLGLWGARKKFKK